MRWCLDVADVVEDARKDGHPKALICVVGHKTSDVIFTCWFVLDVSSVKMTKSRQAMEMCR